MTYNFFPRYRHGKPCIMLKLNRIYDWTVVPYTYDQIVNHTTMPSKLKLDIAQIWEDNCVPRGYVPGGPPCPWLNMAWLHCDGENYADMENIGPVNLNNILCISISYLTF